MANTTLQNCQRIIILLEFATLTLIVTFLTIKIIKKKVDLNSRPQKDEQPPSQSAAQKYKQSQITHHQFDKAAVKSTILNDDDTCTERLMKKICQFNVTFNPLLLAFPLNFILGRSMAFSVVIYFISMICCFIFNIFKVHRACIDIKIGRVFLEILSVGFSVLLLLNIWTTKPSSMLYLLLQG